MDATITVRDFSGGLNTTVDEARLGSQFSASMNNVEVTDSRTIKSRAGYLAVTATAIRSGSEVKSLYRYYTKGGAKKWVALCGTAVFTATDVARSTYGQVAVESITATSATVNDSFFDGGSAVQLTATTTTYSLAVPYSTDVRVKWYGASARARVDSGAWSTFTSGAEISFAGLSATNHTVDIQNNSTRNTTSMRLSPAGQNKYRVRSRSVHSAIGNVTGNVSLSFYDPGNNDSERLVSLWATVDGSTQALVYVGVSPVHSTTHYTVNGVSTSITRSNGWHKVELIITPLNTFSRSIRVAIDDIDIPIVPALPSGTYSDTLLYAIARSKRTDTTAVPTYFDAFRVNYALVDDFTDLTAWAVPSGFSMSSDTDAVSNTYYTSGIDVYIDTLTYQATPAWTRIAAVSATADRLACATYNDRLFFSTRYDAMRYYTAAGTLGTITASGTAPAAEFITTKQQRLFAAGKQVDRGLLEYTAVDSPQNWTDGGALKPWAKDSGADITGVAKWNDALFIFAQNRTRALQIEGDETSWLNRELSDSIGCIAPDTVEVTPNSVIFLAPSGVRAYGLISGVTDTDGSGFLNVSESIQPTIKRINQSYVQKAQAVYYDNKYFLSVPLDDSTENNVTLVYRLPEDGQAGSWTKYDYGFRTLCVTRGDEAALYAGGYDGKLYRLEYGTTDNGSPIAWHWRTPPLTDKQGYAFVRHFRRCHVGVKADSLMPLTITPYTDDVDGQSTTVNVDASTDAKPVRFPLNARGRSLGVDFSSAGSEQSVTVSELTLTYVPGRMR